MVNWLWIVPLLPFAGGAILFASLGRLPHRAVSLVGVGSVGLSAAAAGGFAVAFLVGAAAHPVWHASLGNWIAGDGFRATFGLRLDSLSLVMILVVTFVGFLIHLYSTAYMADDEGYSRFFASMNLFTGSMLVLVLADNLLLLFLGWEGVGLCSYLLIGFWYKDPANGYAARKAFVVTRVGDSAMLMGLILLATSFGTLEIQQILTRAAATWTPGSGVASAAAALLLAGALGKSAQLPLQTWLPDAMAGPTPVSALIHAATMVTAGMYLIARTYELFVLAPAVQLAVAIIGGVGLLLAAFSALAQDDIKRVLAYSTMSQIGYMFLALGVGAWSAAVFHFMTHAFFKALLFLAAGSVILGTHHEQNIFRMGGLRRRMPAVFWTFTAGAAALAAVPVVTSGFYSKEQILLAVWSHGTVGRWLWLSGVSAAFLTSVYIFRVVFVVFFGERRVLADHAHDEPPWHDGHDGHDEHEGHDEATGRDERRGAPPGTTGWAVLIPLGVLAALSIAGGFVDTPVGLGHVTLFAHFVARTLPGTPPEVTNQAVGAALELAAAAASLGGILVAYLLYFPGRERVPARLARSRWVAAARAGWAAGWGFDRLYDALFVRPFLATAALLRDDGFDLVFRGIAGSMRLAWRGTRVTQTGGLRWYAVGMVAGLIVILAVAVFS